jgi:hypothetical protein
MEITNEANKIYTQASKIYRLTNYPRGDATLMCSIHDIVSDGQGENHHNCIACNLESASHLIFKTLPKLQHYDTIEDAYTIFIMTLYLTVERIDVIFNIIQIPDSYRARHFGILKRIRKWANFFKHPKAFMLVHHPNFEYESDPLYSEIKNPVVIDEKFVMLHYSAEDSDRSKKLYDALANKNKVIVKLPDPVAIITEFCDAQKKLVDLIEKNQVYRELLNERASLSDYFVDDDDKNEPTNAEQTK